MKNINLLVTCINILVTWVLLSSCTTSKTKATSECSDNSEQSQNEPTNLVKSIDQPYIIDSIYKQVTFGGWLKLSLEEKEITNNIGLPEHKTKEEFWDAIGTFVQKWEYKKNGVFLDMMSDSIGGSKTILSIYLASPCSLKTNEQIGIGSDENFIKEYYEMHIDMNNSNDSTIIVGSIYGGIVFTLKNEKVSEIFIGAIAE
ncbi:MAG: hypothetical protein JXB49_16245 [Bacteroidales bacterium]|nr:hypothetical protein [Bacteroidales bacterium]